MMRRLPFLVMFLMISNYVLADNLQFGFKNPSFSGIGYSSHVLTIETMEYQRREKLKAEEEARKAAEQRKIDSSNLSKFLLNVEGRIYAQLSKQLVDTMFGENASNSGTVVIEGNTISFVKTADAVTLSIVQSNGNTTTVEVPIGEFKF
jgi:hypothetical protein